MPDHYTRKFKSDELIRYNDSCSVLVHDQIVAESGASPNLSLARGVAAAKALSKLRDTVSEQALSVICNCAQSEHTALLEDHMEPGTTEDETDEGYAHIAYSHLQNSMENDVEESDFAGDNAEENQ